MRRAKNNEAIERLARRMSALEDEAFKEFSDLFGPRIRGFLMLRGLNATDAEDLAVSCITDIALRVDRYREIKGGGFTAWVFTLVRHAMVDWWRSRKTQTVYIDELEAAKLLDTDDSEPNVEIILSVREVLDGLGDLDRRILESRYSGVERSFVAIGEELGMKSNAVRVRHYRALAKLRAALERDARIAKVLQRTATRSEGA